MNMFKKSQLLVAFAAAAILLAFQAPTRADIELPRYHFAVGQQLDYVGHSQAEHQDHPQMDRTDTTLTIWVVRQNPDKSFHLVVLSSTKNGAAPVKTAKDGKENPPVVTLSQVDLTADGDTPDNAATAGQTTPDVFPPLPPTLDEHTPQAWNTTDEDLGQTTTFKPLRQQDRNEFLFEGVHSALTDPIFQTASTATFHFDWSKGLITKIVTQFSQRVGVNILGTTTLELQQIANADPNFIAQLATESDLYFAAQAAAVQATQIATIDPTQTEAKLTEAAAALKNVEPKITLPLLKDQLESQIKSQPDAANFVRDSAKHRAELLAMPPVDWSTTDLAGQPATAANFRGKVVILNFWSIGIPWCISQMPALKALQTDFPNAVVLGFNTGDDPKDAAAVAQQMQLNYGQFKGDALANQLKISELPTTLVLDQTGKIRNINTGFTSKLHDEVAKTVKDLLAPK